MENYIMRNGTKLELTEEQSKIMAKIKDDPFERKPDGAYYYIDNTGEVTVGWDTDASGFGDSVFNVGNYCQNATLLAQRALHETLDRLLWRYSEQHGGDPEWDMHNPHWSIYRTTSDNEWDVDYNDVYKFGKPYFCSGEVAKAAIKEVVEPFCAAHPEFVW